MLTNGDKRGAGFTLLEIMVAITLMAAVMGILFSGLRVATNAWRRGQDKLDAQARRLAVPDVLNAQVSAAVPVLLSTKAGVSASVRYVIFSGSPRELRFLTRASWENDPSMKAWMAIYRVLDTDDRRQQLVVDDIPVPDRSATLAALLDLQPDAARSQRLGEPADRIELSYLQPGSLRAEAAWISDWRASEHDVLPSAVRVRWWRKEKENSMTFLVPVTRPAP